MSDDIEKATREFLLGIAEFDGTPDEPQKFDELVVITAKFVREQVERTLDAVLTSRTPGTKAIFTLFFHEDLKEEDAVDIDIAVKALAIIADRRGGGLGIQARKPDGTQVHVPVLVPVGEAPRGVN